MNSAPLPLAPAILGTGSGGCTHILGNYFLIVPHFSLSIRAEQCASTEVIKRSVDLYTVVTMNPGLTINKDVCRKIVNTVSAPAAIGPYNQVILIIGCSPPHSFIDIGLRREGQIKLVIAVFSCSMLNQCSKAHAQFYFTQAPKLVVGATNI